MREASRGGSDASTSQSYNHIELQRRRIKKAAQPSSDAAGLTYGRKYHGRPTPLRGHGVPPPDQAELVHKPSKQFIPDRSFSSTVGQLLTHDAQSAPAQPHPRMLRLSELSHRSNLVGGGVAIAEEAKEYQPSRRPCTAAGPRTERVLGWGAEPAEPTYLLLATARRDVFVASRPTTAPACVLRSKPVMRAGYDLGGSPNADVVQYRHSGGICPPEYKLLTERPAAPQLAGPAVEQARGSFFDARQAMLANKLRSYDSSGIFGSRRP